jgi:hypothetical protein
MYKIEFFDGKTWKTASTKLFPTIPLAYHYIQNSGQFSKSTPLRTKEVSIQESKRYISYDASHGQDESIGAIWRTNKDKTLSYQGNTQLASVNNEENTNV